MRRECFRVVREQQLEWISHKHLLRNAPLLALVPLSPDSGMAMLSVWFSLLVACLVVVADLAKQNPDVIKWQELKVLMLRTGNSTRGAVPHPQMTAVRRSEVLNNVTCIVAGEVVEQKENFPRVEWSCVPDEMACGSKMNVEKVSCECYDLCRDDYIVIGSCSLEYTVSADFKSVCIIGPFVALVILLIFLHYFCDMHRKETRLWIRNLLVRCRQ